MPPANGPKAKDKYSDNTSQTGERYTMRSTTTPGSKKNGYQQTTTITPVGLDSPNHRIHLPLKQQGEHRLGPKGY